MAVTYCIILLICICSRIFWNMGILMTKFDTPSKWWILFDSLFLKVWYINYLHILIYLAQLVALYVHLCGSAEKWLEQCVFPPQIWPIYIDLYKDNHSWYETYTVPAQIGLFLLHIVHNITNSRSQSWWLLNLLVTRTYFVDVDIEQSC